MSMVLPSHCYERYFLVLPGIAGLDVSDNGYEYQLFEDGSIAITVNTALTFSTVQKAIAFLFPEGDRPF